MNRILIATLFFGSLVSLAAQTPEAHIREKTGTVELLLPGSRNWRPAREGDPVPAGAVLSTGFKSTAVLLLGNSAIIVRPLTRLSIEEILSRDKTEKVDLKLRTGRIRASVTPPAGGKTDFTVRSPIATASVRGTSFDFDTVNIQVTGGTVVFSPAVQTRGAGWRAVQVSAGDRAAVDQDTGRAVHPLKAAETSRSLPGLAGQSSGSGIRPPGAGTPARGSGSLSVNVTLERD
jgi:hypothetical protein